MNFYYAETKEGAPYLLSPEMIGNVIRILLIFFVKTKYSHLDLYYLNLFQVAFQPSKVYLLRSSSDSSHSSLYCWWRCLNGHEYKIVRAVARKLLRIYKSSALFIVYFGQNDYIIFKRQKFTWPTMAYASVLTHKLNTYTVIGCIYRVKNDSRLLRRWFPSLFFLLWVSIVGHGSSDW